jgi:hypothetical protein
MDTRHLLHHVFSLCILFSVFLVDIFMGELILGSLPTYPTVGLPPYVPRFQKPSSCLL